MNFDLQVTLLPQSLATNITDKQVMFANLIYTWECQITLVKQVLLGLPQGTGAMGSWSKVHVFFFLISNFVVHVSACWTLRPPLLYSRILCRTPLWLVCLKCGQ